MIHKEKNQVRWRNNRQRSWLHVCCMFWNRRRNDFFLRMVGIGFFLFFLIDMMHILSSTSYYRQRHHYNPIVIVPSSSLKNSEKISPRHVVLIYNDEHTEMKHVHEVRTTDTENTEFSFMMDAIPQSEDEYSYDLKKSRAAENHHGYHDNEENDEHCGVMMEWQKPSSHNNDNIIMNCNTLHEIMISNQLQYLQKGSFRTVFHLPWINTKLVLKILNFKRSMNYREYDRHRRDALTMNQLTHFDTVPNIYGYCVNSAIFDYSPIGDLNDYLNNHIETISKEEQIQIAHQVISAVADVHSIGRVDDHNNHESAIAHTDITVDQFLYSPTKKIFQLNDFNRVRFVPWNYMTNETCPFYISKSPGKFRSPEEYDYVGLSKQIDVFQLSNVLYVIWTLQDLWMDVSVRRAQKKVLKGDRAPIPTQLQQSQHPIDILFQQLLQMTQNQQPDQRASVSQLKQYLDEKLANLNISTTTYNIALSKSNELNSIKHPKHKLRK